MYGHHHGGWGRGWGGWGGGWGGWGGPYMRRAGFPLFGGFGMGPGIGGGGLIGDLLAGGLGYMMGRGSAAQNQQYQQPYPPQYQQYPPQYQQATPQYQPPDQGSAASAQNTRLAQLRLLGQMRQSGTLTEDEFQAEKQKILNGE